MPFVKHRWIALGLTLAAWAWPSHAQRDLHDYWDARCKDCHGDAGPFARATLEVRDGRLLGKHHRDKLETFLQNHYLADELIAPVTAMLVAQATTAPTFKEHCARCHDTAAVFARQSLVLRDGKLVGKASGRPVVEYLRTHGGLAPAEVAGMVTTLERVLGEVGGGTR